MIAAGGWSRRRWISVGVAALALRLFAWWLAAGRVPLGDPQNYLILAHNMLAGQGMTIDEPRILPGMRALYPPLYPLLLAGVGALVPLGQATLVALNLMTDLATAAMIVLLADRLGLARAGRWAAALYLLWPSTWLAAPLANKEGLINLLMLAGLYALTRAAVGEGRKWAVGTGLAAGLLTLAQPGLAPVFALFFLALRPLFASWRQWWSVALSAAAVTLLVMLPWWVRNALVFGAFVPMTTSTGLALWQGVLRQDDWLPPPDHLRHLGERALDEALRAEAWRLVVADPWAFIRNCFAHLGVAFLRSSGGLGRLIPMQPLAHLPLLFAMVAPVVALFQALTVASLAGMLALRRSLAARLLMAGIVQILAFGIWFEFSERHMHFLLPSMLLVAVAAVIDLVGRHSEPRPNR